MRDPRIDPADGDWLTNGIADVRVDMVRNGQVCFVRFPVGHDMGEAIRLPLSVFRAEAAKAEVMAMSVEAAR